MSNPRGSPENLAPRWQPGKSGNPAGRPKGTGLTDRLRKIVESPEFIEKFPEALIRQMMKGKTDLTREYWARTEGPADAPQAGINVIVVNGAGANQLDGIAELLKMHAEATGGQVIQLGDGDWQEQTAQTDEPVLPEEGA